MKLGDDYQYPIKGSGESSYNLDSGKSMKMKDVLFVEVLKKNLFSMSTLDAKGMRVAFIDGQVLMWPKGNTIDDAVVIGEQEGGLYKLKVFQKYRKNMKVYAKDVQKEITQRGHFQVARARKKESWKSSTPMYAVQCHPAH